MKVWSLLRCNQPHGRGSSVAGKLSSPVVHVGYRDAFAFCVWANKRLPTEPEWQYIAQPAANNRKSLTYTHTRLTALCPGLPYSVSR